jgi:hypothetical protein
MPPQRKEQINSPSVTGSAAQSLRKVSLRKAMSINIDSP